MRTPLWLAAAALAVLGTWMAIGAQERAPAGATFSVVETSIPELQAAMEAGRTTSR